MRKRPGLATTELALAAVTLAAILGMTRLLRDGDWLVPLVVNAIVAHSLLALNRRRGGGLALATVLGVVGAAVTITLTVYPATTFAGLPTGSTLDLLDADLAQSWEAFQILVAPAPVLTGFIVATAAAVWFIAFVADWAAFRLWVPVEATLPAGTLFVFTALLGTADGRAWATAAFAGAVMGFLLLHRITGQEAANHWISGRADRGRRTLLVMGGGLGGFAVAAGLVLGPALPGAGSEPILDARGLDSDPRRVTISPLVDIRARLVDRPDLVVFRVRSTRRAYWRVTALDQFDGGAWTSSGDYDAADGELPRAVPSAAETDLVRQRFTIENLSAIWLPAAYEPRAVRVEDGEARYDEESATLIVDASTATSDGIAYEVTSAVPRYTAEQLRQAPSDVDDDIAELYLDLPDEFSERVRAEAERITAGAPTPYDKALALQTYLRGFTYDLGVARGHGVADMEQFLFEVRRGYCEQFAATFAAMARAVGLPSRVAVGFTPGSVDPDDPHEFEGDPATYVVRGENAHAWAEVYLEGFGWVLFEPTPSRGAPFAEGYTGVRESQAAPGDPSATSAPPTTGAPAPVDDATATTPPGADQLLTEDPGAAFGLGGVPGGGAGIDEGRDWGSDLWFALRWFVLVPAAAALVYAAVLLVLHQRRRERRVPEPLAAVQHAWSVSLDALAVLGFASAPHETHREVAARATREVPGIALPIRDLAELTERITWSNEPPSQSDARRAVAAREAVDTAVRGRTTAIDRLVHAVQSERVMPVHDARLHIDAAQNR